MKEAGVLQVTAGVLIVGIPLLGTGLVNAAGIMARSEDLNRYEKRRLWSYYFAGSFALSFVVPWTTMVLLAGFPVITGLVNRRRKQAPPKLTPAKKIMNGRPTDAYLRELQDAVARLNSELKYVSAQAIPDKNRQAELDQKLDVTIRAYAERAEKIKEAGAARLDVLAISLMLTTLTPLLYLSLTNTPWLAAEKVTLTSKETVVGYVVSTKDDWATLLIDKPRLVRNLPVGDIKQRETCVRTEESNARLTLWNLPKAELPKYPKCPS